MNFLLVIESPFDTMICSIHEKVRAALQTEEGWREAYAFSEAVFCFQQSRISEVREMVYEPALCLILQGAKRTTLGGRTLELGKGDSVLVSHHVPVNACITQATSKEPYIALIVRLDLAIVRSLATEIEKYSGGPSRALSVAAEKADAAILGSVDRLLAILRDPLETKLIGEAASRELHLRLMQAPHGAMLRQLAEKDSIARSISRAVSFIREHYKQALAISEVASAAGMSESLLYQRFREITGTTPKQYVKSLRLQEAHSLLSLQGYSVTDAAFAVGYESSQHFSRDYSRKFGLSPKKSRLTVA